MNQKIRRKFIQGSTLEELEEKLNEFTDKFNPADILEVQFFALQASYKIKVKAEKRMSINNPTEVTESDETQTPTDKLVCFVTYNEGSKEIDIHG